MWDKIKKALLSKTGKIALLILSCYALILFAGVLLVDGRYVRFYMTDQQEISIEYGTGYTDPGIYAVSNGRLFGESKDRLDVKTVGEVDSHKLGSYELRYICRMFFRDYETYRIVNVVDTTAPEIELLHQEGYEANWFTGYQEEGFKATDLCDGDVTDMVTTEMVDDKVIYTVSDASGNTATAERLIKYSITEPEIILDGGEHYEINARMYFEDPGYRAVDTLGNDLTEHISVEGEVVPYTPGDYTITYTISNELGQSVIATRTVSVHQARNPDAVEPGQKTIYLTFDDGPGPYTGALLDVLSAYNVKATFFVTCLNDKYENYIGRAYDEGHAIGVHSASHNYREIYSSEDAFFTDFNAVQDMIYRQTGEYTDIFRFPGGSSNTVSSFNPGIMSRLAEGLNSMGYQYFDWNVSSGDAGETTDTAQVVENIINGCAGMKYPVVLQHDIKDYSVYAVEQVIIWGLNNGYVFRALEPSSPAAHHGIAN